MKEKVVKLKNGIGINLRYSIDKNKEPVLFLHFSGGNSAMWEGVFPYFENDFSVIAPDMRGHGKSDKPREGYHIAKMAEDVYFLLEEMDVARCHIVGSSMGAEIGVCLAAAHPEKVLSLVCEGALYNEFGEYGLFQGSDEEIELYKNNIREQLSARKSVFETEEEFINGQKAGLQEQGIWNDNFLHFFKNTLEQMEDGRYTYRYRDHVRREYIEQYWSLQFEEYYKRAACPVLFLPSEEEAKNPIINNSLKVFSGLLEHSRVFHIKDSLHAYVWMQDPKSASEAVLAFLTETRALVTDHM